MAEAPLLVIAAGGTGGHMFPAQALAEAMLGRGWRVRLATDARGARYAMGFPEAVERVVTAAASLSQGGLARRVTAPFSVAAGAAASIAAMRRERPDCVAGFGGYPALPAMIAATALQIPRLIHEANGVLGRVNRAFARRVDVVACGTWPTEVPEGARVVHTGNPVRAAVLAEQGATYVMPGDWPMGLLVIGGSQGAGLFARVVPEALRLLDPGLRARLRLAQQVRPEDMARTGDVYADLGIEADLRGFFEDVPQRLAEATLVISRAGASSIADVTVIGRPAILIPYAAATDDHQAANALGLVEAGGAFMIREEDLTAEGLAGHITAILADAEGAAAMAEASLAQGRPDAAEHLAGLVVELAQQGRNA
ncbi:MAG TPA: UDP-N-acetylglucosamine--N-acetylmuramyl-(pentapeptide) pyrophosphoryl-undecaprenol N-acetylglucosamine transferase [Amaricoccus sp.]|uniref:UDP-N-acetylglucosamine--N-acetylmuramyl- (pentapeptide) pyrophosphoryl-undecaprenol N-acetylglucosamine transferase n=1 Tax=Amaricoccus sp. TaxID=1872485 RepID=UPI002B5C51F4|nr:UDP-N-acetylglucosamine--N-acetylmuramyl-(pentapeptide) pyrophosphoryl-undecaprenol N-acetylglucosamine transferase [Amaricoccus sp.]HMQ91708.1 UDP-N-acetylglucosamine--N-acetylmuramyl-(pentapeptide) pyrophosphoryl-undecaprenol N-acetylglucosamine transferase [Amaricoccus sp.]HMR52580.1 UDP-N-acetylglucosamine--N-acetylmuramyl-(pentapeptide) pyrophosphoryl-undecaprenol N-acetylglucosamine transferase [Amaricoccus sp.]HMT99550.1 UDP-N-acetylglucosamine--N-acetylmuramyl-(pentapeptide) pyrophosp